MIGSNTIDETVKSIKETAGTGKVRKVAINPNYTGGMGMPSFVQMDTRFTNQKLQADVNFADNIANASS